MTTSNQSKTITHKLTGEEITFLKSSEDTRGEYEYIEVYLPPKGEGPPLHYHRSFEEEFEVIDGELKLIIGEEERILTAGELLTVPKKTHHMFLNASNERPVTFRVKLTPAHHFETSMRIIYGLIEDGEVDEKGMLKSKMYTAIVLDMQDSRIVQVPKIVQKFVLDRLAKRGKKQGIDEMLIKKYVKA
ncbi:cupin domain-containing protein [Bacillus shivajii]|uniref:cupin domain-containing protein n=1 Tax=Bacillus shivajii TaxID=1983719 RepID=UPI001CFA63A3|nr:cupin domain-containing protein [Bacillus shivajii]UCZ52471.1 cupin domain-containing protein [Bacillus shivajii]